MSGLMSRYRTWRGGPMSRRAELIWLLDELLDRIPAWDFAAGGMKVTDDCGPVSGDGLPEVTRFEVIDHAPGVVSYHPDTARSLVARNVKVELSVQDEGRTLKVFLTRLDADEPPVCPKCGMAGRLGLHRWWGEDD